MFLKRKIYKSDNLKIIMVLKTSKVSVEDLSQIKRDLALIKNFILGENELTEWAKNELEKARKTPISECISHDEVESMLL